MEKVSKEFQERFDRDVYAVITDTNGEKAIRLMYYVYQEGHDYPQVVWPERFTILPVPVTYDSVLDAWQDAPQQQADLDEDFPDVETEIVTHTELDIEKVTQDTPEGIFIDIKR